MPIRVLHILHSMNRGGAENAIMNYYRHIDRSKVQFDFLLTEPNKCQFEDEIISLGGKVYRVPLKPFLRKPQIFLGFVCVPFVRDANVGKRHAKPLERMFHRKRASKLPRLPIWTGQGEVFHNSEIHFITVTPSGNAIIRSLISQKPSPSGGRRPSVSVRCPAGVEEVASPFPL